VAKASDAVADTLFHELLHAWFMTTFPGASIETGHTKDALPIGDPKFSAAEYDPEFLDRLQRFMKQMEVLRQKAAKQKSKP
jgi:hypothetical protein